ncbi:MAG: extracellular solute-binding protein [Lachnospiraceae bacterium]
MKKKILGVLLCLAMTASMVGCGGTDDTSKGSDDKKTEDSTDKTDKTADKGDEKTLTVWCWDPAFNIYAMEEAAKEYKTANPDVNVKIVEAPWEDIQTKLTTAATSGKYDTLPDILLMQDNAFQKNVISYPDAFLDLTDSGIDYTKFATGKTAYSVVNDKNYGVPFDNGAVIACYRTDILKEAGYTVADFTDITWSDYIAKGKEVLAKTGKPLLSCVSGESDVITMMLQSTGSSLFDKEGNPSMVGNKELKKVMETYAEMIKAGVLVENNDWDQYVGGMTNSGVAGTINGCWIMGSIQTAEDQSGKWAITNMPKMDGVDAATNYSNNGGSSWAVTSNCKNPELAKDFLATTFAGSVGLYETILPKSGALATYLPAGDSDAYAKPSEFFGGDAVFSKITDFASKVPSNNTGVYYYEARDAIGTAIINVVGGADIDGEIKTAQDTINFAMEQ